MRYELNDHEWAAIKPMLPNKPRGVPRVNDRRVLNGTSHQCGYSCESMSPRPRRLLKNSPRSFRPSEASAGIHNPCLNYCGNAGVMDSGIAPLTRPGMTAESFSSSSSLRSSPRKRGPREADRELAVCSPWIRACAGMNGCGCGSTQADSALGRPLAAFSAPRRRPSRSTPRSGRTEWRAPPVCGCRRGPD